MRPTGDQLLAMLAALANPLRLRIVAALGAGGRNYVSQLAREIGISRPLLHLHLQKLEAAGLVTSQHEVSPISERPFRFGCWRAASAWLRRALPHAS